MSQKKNNQDIVNNIIKLSFEHKNVVTKFVQAVQDAIIDGLREDGLVEIDKFGTFSTLKVAPREGVNVSNGEKITVPEFTKFSFSPKFRSLSKTEENDNGSSSDTDETAEDEDGTVTTDETDTSDEMDTAPEEDIIVEQPGELADTDESSTEMDELPQPEPVKEKPADQFSGIDVLISTPESLEDTKERLEEAKRREEEFAETVSKAKAAVEDALKILEQAKADLRAAQDDIHDISQTIENVEENRRAVIDKGEEDTEADQNDKTNDNADKEEPSKRPVFSAPKDKRNKAENNGKPSMKKNRFIWIAAVAVFCVAAILLSILFCSKPDDSNKTAKQPDKEQSSSARQSAEKAAASQGSQAVQQTDTLAKDSVPRSEIEKNMKGTTLTKVDTVVFDGTEYLENIVTNHYGEHDMVYRVIQFNRKHGLLQDLNHIPIGSNILLPHYE